MSTTTTTGGSPGTNSTASSSKAHVQPSIWEVFYPRDVDGHREVIHVASFPEIVFFWPTVLICFLCALFQATGLVDQVTLGWLAVIVLSFNFLALVQDFDQKQFIILVLVVFALVLGIWIVNLYGFSFFKSAAGWISGFQPSFSTDAYLLLGFIMLVFFTWGAVSAMFDFWKFEQNEFVHFSQPIGRDMSIARIGCTVNKEIPDVLEYILTGGGGTLVIKRNNEVLASIRNVPFLRRRMIALDHMLSETRVTVSTEQV